MNVSSRAFAIAAAISVFAWPSAFAQTTPAAQEPVDTGYVNYDDGPISLPLGVGLRIPLYDRVDGLALPFGPMITLAGGRFELDPTVTYRSHLGKFDPYGKATVKLGARDALKVDGGRATFTNDAWIRNTIVNSLATLGVGSDARNYFRADRLTAELTHEAVGNGTTFTPRIGFLHENAWSTGTPVPHTSAPWSISGRTGSRKMRRINPSIARGHTTSGTAGLNYDYDLNQMTVAIDAGIEHAFDAPSTATNSSGDFTQMTLDGKAKFLTFGTQYFTFSTHALVTPGDDAPAQRYSYLGGAGTLATVDLLAIGGDRLAYVEGEYTVPLTKPLLPFVGSPIVSLRYAAGSAGVGSLPDFIQNIGVGLGMKFIRAEYHVDPNYRKTPYTHKSAFSIGLSLSL
ncbi:MAG: hypothetical protein ABIQ55_04645 [Gemmatimonadaceae bacterium]